MRPTDLVYFYRRRLRVHAVPELLAGIGVAIAVALVFATLVASASISGSAGELVHTVIGPASLQIRARGSEGMPFGMLARVESLPGVKQAGPLLEQTATIVGPSGSRVTVDLASTDTSLVVLDGLAHTLPISTLSPGGLGLSTTTAQALGLTGAQPKTAVVSLQLRGRSIPSKVSAILGRETFGALWQGRVAVMPLDDLQRLAGLPGQITRVLVQTKPGAQQRVRKELEALAGGRFTVQPANADLRLLEQALRPSDQASGFFAAISALLGFLLAFNALLLTVPERRQAIANRRLDGHKRSAIVQMVLFQALCLGVAACGVGLCGGYLLAHGLLHQSTGYLTEAFTLGTRTVVGIRPLVLSVLGGLLATFAASTVPLLDLRGNRSLNAVYTQGGVPGNTLNSGAQRRLAVVATVLVGAATAMFALAPNLALLACALLALASVCVVPLAFVGVLRLARELTDRSEHFSVLAEALTSLKGTTVRSLALAGTGAVAIFGSIALGGSREDLLHGISGFTRSYSADAPIWVTNPGDNQATVGFRPDRYEQRIAAVPAVASVNSFQGGFLQLGNRRVWVIARPPGEDAKVLTSQISSGNVAVAVRRLGEGGWIAVSKQIADEHHAAIGGTLTLPTPSGTVALRVAATTTNLTWPPGVIFMASADYTQYWEPTRSPTQPPVPTALAVHLRPGTNIGLARQAIVQALGPSSGLEVATAAHREASINTLANEGLNQLAEISTLLLLAAILALVAAGTSAMWQRRASLAGLRLDGLKPHRLRRILLAESALMLGAGCLTGAIAGIYGQVIIDGYLKTITGFPVVRLGATFRPLEVFAVVIAVVLTLVTIPGWFASRVPPMLALDE